MDDAHKDRPVETSHPNTGAVLMAMGLASLALLAIHPGGQAHDFAGVLTEEAANRATDALVHGGFIVVLAVELVCYAVFARRLARTASLAGLVFFAAGAAFLAASMLVDGLVVPALAAKYLPAPDKYDTARGLFALCGILISLLMPIGIGFQAAAIASWGWALFHGGAARIIGIVGMVTGMLALAAVAHHTANPLALMGGIGALALWALLAGFTLTRKAN